MLTLRLDHLAVLGETLEEACEHIESSLQQPLHPGGQHAHFGTHNRLLGLAGELYLEAIAIDPGVPKPAYPRWFGLDTFRGAARLDKWILRTTDIDAAIDAFPMAGRRVDLSRGDLRWSMAVPEDGLLPFDGCFPALIQWHSDVPPGKLLVNPGTRLDRLLVTHPRAQALSDLLAGALQDAPVRFEPGPDPALAARIDLPEGTVWLR